MESNNIYRAELHSREPEIYQLYAQLPPHFLFNTMNSLYALSLEDDARTRRGLARITHGIAKISDLLRSFLYECNVSSIPITKEIDIIQDFIDLELLRFEDKVDVNFNCSILYGHLNIAPLILFTFVENCFKHSCRVVSDTAFIKIDLLGTEDSILFHAENSTASDNNSGQNKHKGVGLENVKKRLEANYHGQYSLSIKEELSCFHVNLYIHNLEV